MATNKPKTRRKSGGVSKRRHTARHRAKAPDAPLAGIKGAERRQIGHVQLEVGRAGAARVKRMVYPAGFRWSVDMKPIVGTDRCMHAHVGFLERGEIHIEYAMAARPNTRRRRSWPSNQATTVGWWARSRRC